MTEKIKLKAEKLFLIAGLILLLLFAAAITLAQITNQKINEGSSNVYSDQQLTCSWILNETSISNVSWYRNSVLNTTQINISCTAFVACSTFGDGNIPASYIARGDTWTCVVSYYNGTDNESSNVSVSIINSPPTSPRVFRQNGSEVINVTVQIAEDNTTIFLLNSTDKDGDNVTYTINDTAFCTVNSSAGTLTCTPTLESTNGGRAIKIKSEDDAGATLGYVTTLILNVTPTNDAPTVILINKTVNESQALNYTITGTDAENNTPFTFSIAGLSSLIINSTSNTTARITFNNSGLDKAMYADRGNHTINVTIFDSFGANSTSFFNLEVIPVNHLANISFIPNQTGIQGGSLLLYVNATDIDNDTLTFYTNDSLYNITTVSNTHNGSGVTYAVGLINITNLTNNHVIHTNINITVSDTKQNSSQIVFFNITNTNDAPTIQEISSYATNTLNNTNISKMIAYSGVAFSYRVNATDVDTLTYAGDILTFSTNNSDFSINSSTGIISFTKNDSYLGNYSFIVTAADSYGLTFNRTANLSIYPNTNPYFNQTLPNFVCYEYDSSGYPSNCTYNLSIYSKETDSGDYVANYSTNLSSFNLSSVYSVNSTTGIITINAQQADVGNYSVQITITDSRGGSNSTTLNLSILNTNNLPVLNAVTFPTIIVGTTYTITLTASDNDMNLTNSYENLTFNKSIAGPNSQLFSVVKNSSTTAYISFTPNSSDIGNYSANISVRDYYNNISTRNISFYVYNQTALPTIYNITPYGTYYSNGTLNTSNLINTSWISVNISTFPDNATNITINENTTYIFNQTSAADNSSYANSLTYAWYVNGTLASTSRALNRSFDFFSSGNHTMRFTASDDFHNNNTFTWYVTVSNVNRMPLLLNPLDNLTVSGTTTYSSYLLRYNSLTKFIDPDNDLDSNNTIDSTETNTLTYNATACSYATLTFVGSDLKVTPTSVGTCYVNFTAIDSLNSSMRVTSNRVVLNITSVSNDTGTQIIYVTTSGASSTRTVSVPIPLDVEKPVPLKIIVPTSTSMYRNSTVTVTIVLNNTWSETLEGVRLSAYTNASNVTFSFDKDYFARIVKGVPEKVLLTISNYKTEGHYEIEIIANVTNPAYTDTAILFINSAELAAGAEEFEVKIAFARDLLSSNPECQELNELLNQARDDIANNNFDRASRLIDGVVSGCKYLMNNAKNNVESPRRDFIKLFQWNKKYTDYLIIGAFSLLLIIGLYFAFKKEKSEEKFD